MSLPNNRICCRSELLDRSKALRLKSDKLLSDLQCCKVDEKTMENLGRIVERIDVRGAEQNEAARKDKELDLNRRSKLNPTHSFIQ